MINENLESKLISLLDDGNKSPNENEKIYVPGEKRARLASSAAGTSNNIKSNVQTILSNILLSNDVNDGTTTFEEHVIFDKVS